jgi:hypothetical protein
MITQQAEGFLACSNDLKDNSPPISCVLVLLVTIGVVLDSSDLLLWGASTPPFISKGDEVTRKIIESVVI